ncbi:hypothetical protein SPBR_00315 [Sporothrix brasiliensis 5110]|uniref:Uncharacterized protein n=1 Tax=Sporothrix brasiliensis 5110 TaxID=1398154 RepID=A0A0C2FGR9_9PEZI|nr:uncharacterized protein SPBR_00315 [Sporothrix brasiliensis 5110]KIH90263.1 hypothetical protein SPBR_00315 [Sporothrix brasiliensis 5110]
MPFVLLLLLALAMEFMEFIPIPTPFLLGVDAVVVVGVMDAIEPMPGGGGRLNPELGGLAAADDAPVPGGGDREKLDEVVAAGELHALPLFMLPLPAPQLMPLVVAGGDVVAGSDGVMADHAGALLMAVLPAEVVVGFKGRAGSAFENCVDEGVMAAKLLRSGVTVRNAGCCCGFGAGGACAVVGVGVGVDHENAGAVEAAADAVARGVVLRLPPRFGDGRLALAAGAASQPPSIKASPTRPPVLPLTSRSKSSSTSPPPPPPTSKAEPPIPAPNDENSSMRAALPFKEEWAAAASTPDSSCSLRTCSSSTRDDSVLISFINAWNCFRFRSGPRLMVHSTGKSSNATKSASTMPPTTRKTFRASIITAGSLVLMPLISGTIFSCMVYLSSAVDVDVPRLGSLPLSPSRPSPPPSSVLSGEPPHRMTNACRPRILIARLLVLLKMAATTGNSSCLIVLKSSTGSMAGTLRSAASTTAGVGESSAVATMGKTSSLNSLPVVLSVMIASRSSTTMRLASRDGSRSCAVFLWLALPPAAAAAAAPGTKKCSLRHGSTRSEKTRLADGSSSTILNTFCKICGASSRSFISSSRAGSTFFSMTDLGNDGSTLLSPRINDDFSPCVLAGKASRNRMVDTRMLSKYSLVWNSFAVRRCAGRRAIRRGSTCTASSRGSGRDDR